MKRALLWVGIAVGITMLPIVVMAIWGALLPRDHTSFRTVHVSAPPDEVFALITEVERSSEWRPDVDRVEILGDVDGHPRWVEHGEWGAISMERIASNPPSRIVHRIVDTGEPFGGTWTYEIVGRDGGTDLTITENGWVDNPVFRFLSAKVFGHDTTIRDYQTAIVAELAADRDR